MIVPWAQLTAVVERLYPKISEAGRRPPFPLERMLRVYFLQLWFNLSDPAAEEALYDSASMRDFAGIDLGIEAAPDETTVCKFRHLLEKHKLWKKLLVSVNEHLRRSGIKITTRTIVDATIIGAPSSTRNKVRKRNPEMHQTAKGKQWHFGMKTHIGVDSRTKLVHMVLASAANVADCHALQQLLQGKERRVWGDQAYKGQRAAIRAGAPQAKGFTNQQYRSGKRIDESVKPDYRRKSSVRAKVEHVSGIVKRVFGLQKVCFRGLAKNLHRLEANAALANLFLMRGRLLNA